MKKTIFLFFVVLAFPLAALSEVKTGEDVFAAMYKKYQGKWYKTLTFFQKVIHHNPDGTTRSEIWYEVISPPGNLRIDIDPVEKGNGVIYTDGKVYQLLRVRLDPALQLIPEISGHRLMVSVRLMRAEADGRLRPAHEDASFEMALCA